MPIRCVAFGKKPVPCASAKVYNITSRFDERVYDITVGLDKMVYDIIVKLERRLTMSGSQKFVLVISILNILGGIFAIIAGIAAVLVANQAANEATPRIIAVGVLMMLCGLLQILTGLVGIRAARGAGKSGLFYNMALATLIGNIASILGSIAATGFSVAILFTIVLPALMYICARRIRMQGE